MRGEVDTSFETLQRDLFASGMAAKIGMNAFGVWLAIKSHADFATGECWPGMRRLADLTGLAVGTVQKSVHVLLDAKLLRIKKEGRKGRGNTYVARERMDMRLGDRVLCTIVLDYVPNVLRQRLSQIEQTLKTGESNPDLWADCEIIPGPGFTWDPQGGVLRAQIHARDIPPTVGEVEEGKVLTELQRRVLALANAKTCG